MRAAQKEKAPSAAARGALTKIDNGEFTLTTPLLNESVIPPELLPKARAWFQRRMDYYAAKHGTAWADTREWIADYINEELREHLEKKGARHDL